MTVRRVKQPRRQVNEVYQLTGRASVFRSTTDATPQGNLRRQAPLGDPNLLTGHRANEQLREERHICRNTRLKNIQAPVGDPNLLTGSIGPMNSSVRSGIFVETRA